MIILGLLEITFHINQVLVDATTKLQMRLYKINSFYANFIQKTTSIGGNLIQQGEIKQPNLFN
ncbi:MAG: hypothetical protein ACTS77_02400 [Arsenophonus sp. NC-TX2-MAG3]